MNRIFPFFAFLLLLSCSDNEDPKKTEIQFSGITQTSETGEQFGEVDSNDWKPFICKTGKAIGVVAPNSTKPRPAYPNPTTFGISFPIDFGKEGKLKMIMKKNESTIVTTFYDSLKYSLGFHILSFDLSKYENGIYRIEYEVTIDSIIYSSFGDIKIQK